MCAKLKPVLFFVLFLFLSVSALHAQSGRLLSEESFQEAIKTINLQRIELILLNQELEKVLIELKSLKGQLASLNEELVMSQEEAHLLSIIIDGLRKSYNLQKSLNDVYPWIIAGTVVVCIVGGIIIGLQF